MPRDNEFVNYVLDQLGFLHGLHARAMFGGHGLYQDEIIFAIIVNDMLYFKASEVTQGDFEAKGLSPFSYTARGKTMTMQYYEAPAEVFEDADAMRVWTDKALQAALIAKAKKSGKPKG
jgi:DNA transformation protein